MHGGEVMAKGFGIVALVMAIIAIFIPFYGIYISIIALIFAVMAALAGDRIFATATPLIVLVNTFFLSPMTRAALSGSEQLAVIGSAAPFIAMILNAVGRGLFSGSMQMSMGASTGSNWPTYSQKQAMAQFWSDYGLYIAVVGVLIVVCVTYGPIWIELIKEKLNKDREIPPKPIATVPVDIGPTVQTILGIAGRVRGIRIISPDEVSMAKGATAIGNDVQNGLHYVCYLADVSTCEAAFKQEATLQRQAATTT
jgi:hypothetical protein